MLIYFIPIIIALIGAFLNGRLTAVSRKLLYIITTVVAIFVYCCVYLNGSDWPNYEEFFNQVTWSNLIQLSSERGFEIGFTFVLFCFKSIGFGFFPFLIVAKSFSLIVISNFFKRYAKEQGQGYSANVFFLLFMFYAGNCMYLYVETIIRFSMALAIVVYAYRFLLNRRFWPYLFYIIIAVTFHRTAILMLPIYFIHRTTIPNKVWIIIFAFLIVLLTPQFLLMFIESISQFIPQIYYIYLKGYMEFAVINGSNILSIGNVVHLFFLLLCLLERKRITTCFNNGDKLFIYVIVFFLLYYITVYAGSIGRISLYFRPIFIIVFASILSSNKIFKTLILSFVVLYFLLGMRNVIIEKKSFLPYTNYFISVLSGDNLSFEERISCSNKD